MWNWTERRVRRRKEESCGWREAARELRVVSVRGMRVSRANLSDALRVRRKSDVARRHGIRHDAMTWHHNTRRDVTGQDAAWRARTKHITSATRREEMTSQDAIRHKATRHFMMTCHDITCHDQAWHEARWRDTTRDDATRQDTTPHDTTRFFFLHDITWQDAKRQEIPGQDKTGQDSIGQHSTAQHSTAQDRTGQDRTGSELDTLTANHSSSAVSNARELHTVTGNYKSSGTQVIPATPGDHLCAQVSR